MKIANVLFLMAALTLGTARADLIPADVDDDAWAEGDEVVAPLTAQEQARLNAFVPATQPAEWNGPTLDPQKKVNPRMLAEALAYFQANESRIANKDWLTIVDFSKKSNTERMFLVDLKTGAVHARHVAHGSGSDPRATGLATIFSNVSGSNCSSLGFYLTAETYSGKYGYSCRMDGLSETNSNVRPRAVVIHGSEYVYDRDVIQGRSWGCFALSMTTRTFVIDRLKEGSLIYASR